MAEAQGRSVPEGAPRAPDSRLRVGGPDSPERKSFLPCIQRIVRGNAARLHHSAEVGAGAESNVNYRGTAPSYRTRQRFRRSVALFQVIPTGRRRASERLASTKPHRRSSPSEKSAACSQSSVLSPECDRLTPQCPGLLGQSFNGSNSGVGDGVKFGSGYPCVDFYVQQTYETKNPNPIRPVVLLQIS